MSFATLPEPVLPTCLDPVDIELALGSAEPSVLIEALLLEAERSLVFLTDGGVDVRRLTGRTRRLQGHQFMPCSHEFMPSRGCSIDVSAARCPRGSSLPPLLRRRP